MWIYQCVTWIIYDGFEVSNIYTHSLTQIYIYTHAHAHIYTHILTQTRKNTQKFTHHLNTYIQAKSYTVLYICALQHIYDDKDQDKSFLLNKKSSIYLYYWQRTSMRKQTYFLTHFSDIFVTHFFTESRAFSCSHWYYY